MKKWMGLAALICVPGALAAPELGEPLWETGELRTPESVLVHTLDGQTVLLVSEIEGDPTGADGEGGIALLGADGSMIDQDFVRGLSAPKGMAVHGSALYVSDIDKLVAIDLVTRKIVARYPVADAVFLNDVAVDAEGVVYVSDTRTGKVHRLIDGVIDTYLEGLDGANGLYVDGDALYIGAGPRLLVARAGEVSPVAEGFGDGIDGVEALAEGGFIVTCWVGLVYHVSDEGEVTRLRDTRDPQMNTADIGYDPRTNRLYIPTFFTNSVRAYAL
ncbi:MAG TPA: GTP-binding protein [Cellvibrionaceae bacterium]